MADIHISIPSKPHISLSADRPHYSDDELARLRKEYRDAILAAINALCIPRIVVGNDILTQLLAPNTLYIFTSRTNDLTLTLGEPLTGKVSEYHFIIIADGTPTVTFPENLTWNGDEPPAIEQGNTYEFSILNNIATAMEVSL